jgi:hypothetical protein
MVERAALSKWSRLVHRQARDVLCLHVHVSHILQYRLSGSYLMVLVRHVSKSGVPKVNYHAKGRCQQTAASTQLRRSLAPTPLWSHSQHCSTKTSTRHHKLFDLNHSVKMVQLCDISRYGNGSNRYWRLDSGKTLSARRLRSQLAHRNFTTLKKSTNPV